MHDTLAGWLFVCGGEGGGLTLLNLSSSIGSFFVSKKWLSSASLLLGPQNMNLADSEVQIPEIVMYWTIKIFLYEVVFHFSFKFNLVQF